MKNLTGSWSTKMANYLNQNKSKIRGDIEILRSQIVANKQAIDNLEFERLYDKASISIGSSQGFYIGLYHLLGFLVKPAEFDIYSNADDALNYEYEFELEDSSGSGFKLYGPLVEVEDYKNHLKGVTGYEELPTVASFKEDQDEYLTDEVLDWVIGVFRSNGATDAYSELFEEMVSENDDYDEDDEEFDAEEACATESVKTKKKSEAATESFDPIEKEIYEAMKKGRTNIL